MKRHGHVLLAVMLVIGTVAATFSAGALAATDSATVERPSEPAARATPDLPEQWRHTYGGSGDDIFADVVRTADGGYLAVGWKGGDDRDGWVVKTDGEGTEQWTKTFGGSGTDRFYGVSKTDDGYLLAGRTDRDGGAKGWILELDAEGEKTNERTPGSGAFYALEADDSGYLLAGWTRGEGTEGWAMRLDRDGSEAWSRSYAAPDGYDSGYLRAVVPADDGYYLAGKIEGDSDDAWALRVGPDGAQRWNATAGGPARDDVWAAASADSGVVVVGETESDSDGPRDGWLVKFDANGSQSWERRHGGSGVDWLDSAARTDDGYLFTGSSKTDSGVDGYVLATDDDGTVRSESYYGTESWDKPWPHVPAHGGGYVLAGQTAGDGADGKDGWLVRIGSDGGENATSGTAETMGTTRATSDANATNGAMVPNTETATVQDGTSGGVPGFGFAVAVLSLLGATLLVRYRRERR